MKSFHEQFRHCRSLSGLTQREVGRAINKSGSTINKLEAGGKVAVPDLTDTDLLIDLFRRKGVPEDELVKFKTSWEIAYGARRVSPTLDVSVVNVVGKVSEELIPQEQDALINDIKKISNLWLTFHRINEDFDSSELSFSETEEKLTEIIDDIENGLILKASALFRRGVQRRYQGKNRQAERDFLDALFIIEYIRNVDPRFHIQVRIETGDHYRRMEAKERLKAKKHYSKAREIYTTLNDEKGQSIINLREASLSLGAGNPREDLGLCKKSLDFSRRNGERGIERKALEYLAWAYSMLGHLDEALSMQQEACEITMDLGLHAKEVAKSLRYLGDFYQQCGLIEEAEKAYLDADMFIRKTREKIEDPGEEKEIILSGWVLLGLAGVYMKKPENRDDAYKCVNESLDIARELEDPVLIGLSYTKEGELYLEDERVNKAWKSFEDARYYFERSGISETGSQKNHNPYYISSLEMNLARLEFISKNNSEAREFLSSVIENAERFGFTEYLVRAKLFLAKINLFSPDHCLEEPHQLYTDAVIEAIPCGVYLLTNVLTAIKLDLFQLRKRDKDQALTLSNRILDNWPNELKSLIDDRTSDLIAKWFAELREERDRWMEQSAFAL